MEMAELVGTLFIVFLAFWRKDIFLYIVATPVCITFGLGWYDYYKTPAGLTMAMVVGAIGLYCIYLAIAKLVR